MKNLSKLFTALSIVIITSCTSDDTVTIINEEELITTVELELTNSTDPGNVILFRSVDIDGDGPDAPVTSVTGTINANSTYLGQVSFLNESIAPSEDITEEVIEESNDHEVFYTTTITDLMITKTDVDLNGNPLGVSTRFQTGATGTGTLNVILRHEPIKPNDNTLIGAGGETDAQVSFTFEVQ